ncbi:hypothetical protein CJF31_00007275 [Rutstroemia sp. NJR-2017a BVV2]|nr:hypothetical protein CJF31_00007275 [Rutstroemia sp. NJR-2017a BVV2]
MPSLKKSRHEDEDVSQCDGISNEHFKPYKVAMPEVTITKKRKLYMPGPDTELIDPGTAQATAYRCCIPRASGGDDEG